MDSVCIADELRVRRFVKISLTRLAVVRPMIGAMQSNQQRVYRFSEFEIDARSGELRRNGQRVPLQEQPLQVLLVMLQRAGELITREELRHSIWPEDTFVEFDSALNTAVKKIRLALRDDASAPRYVETVPRRGYRFIAEVNCVHLESSVEAKGKWAGWDELFWPAMLALAFMAGYVLRMIVSGQ